MTPVQLIVKIIGLTPALEGLFRLVLAEYLSVKYKIDRASYIEAEKKAKQGDVTEMQKQIGRFLVLALCVGLLGCAGAPTTSLCLLDFQAQRCWVEKSLGVGYHFSDMNVMQEMCQETGSKCWYAIDSKDLARIQAKLSK